MDCRSLFLPKGDAVKLHSLSADSGKSLVKSLYCSKALTHAVKLNTDLRAPLNTPDMHFKMILYLFFGLSILIVAYSVVIYTFTKPSTEGDWEYGQEKTSEVTLLEKKSDTLIHIDNLRNFDWSETDQPAWESLSFSLSDLSKLEVAVSHFSTVSELAHVFLIFSLNDGRRFGLSIESRREQGESFSLLDGLRAKYEMIYILASTEDLLGLRIQRNETVYVYPIKVSPENIQALFLNFSNKINHLNHSPELYHLFFRNCTNQIVKQVNKLSDESYSWLVQTFVPGNTGKALFQMGLVDTDESDFEQVKKEFILK